MRWLKITMPLGIAALLVAVLAIGFQVPSGLAAPGGNGNGGKTTLTIVPISGGNPYNFGESVNFAVNGRDSGSLWVVNQCFQGGERVYSESHAVVDGVAGPFTLGPTMMWTGGAADCVGQVWETSNNAKPVNGASVSYHVEA